SHEHAGLQFVALVRDARTHEDGAGLFVDHRLHRIDASAKLLARIGVEPDRNFLIGPDLGHVQLGYAEIRLDGADALETDDVGTRLHVGTRADHAQADGTGERRADHRFRHPRLGFGKVCLQAVNGTELHIERVLADEVLLVQFAGTRQALLFGLEVGTDRRGLCVVLGIVYGDQAGSGGNGLSFLKMQTDDTAVDLRADDYRFFGQQRSDRGHFIRHFAYFDRHGSYRQAHRRLCCLASRGRRGLGRIGLLSLGLLFGLLSGSRTVLGIAPGG